jgi:hypothetical protein
MKPRYFNRKPDEPLLFWNWPIFKNGRWSQYVPDEEPQMTEKEAREIETNNN